MASSSQWLNDYKRKVFSLERMLQVPLDWGDAFLPEDKAQTLTQMKELLVQCVSTVTSHSYAVVRVELMMTPSCSETMTSPIATLTDLIDSYCGGVHATMIKTELPEDIMTGMDTTEYTMTSDGASDGDNEIRTSFLKEDVDNNFSFESRQQFNDSDTMEVALPIVNTPDDKKGMHVCPYCGKAIKVKRNYLYHLYRTHDIRSKEMKLYRCPHTGCDYAAPTPPMIERHVKTHKLGMRRTVLDDSWNDHNNVTELTGTLSYKKFNCFLCSHRAVFCSQGELNCHMEQEHATVTEESKCIQCLICDKQISKTKTVEDKLTFDIGSTCYALLVHLVKEHEWKLPKYVQTFPCPNENCTFAGLQSKEVAQHIEQNQCGDLTIQVSEGEDYDDGDDVDDTQPCDDEPDDDLTPSGMFHCRYCGKEIKVRKNYVYHVFRVHKLRLNELSLIACSHKGCRYQAPTEHMINRHLKKHNKPKHHSSRKNFGWGSKHHVLTYKKTQCVLCENVTDFQDIDALKLHFTETHITRNVDNQCTVQCSQCEKTIFNPECNEPDVDELSFRLVKHMCTHSEWQLPSCLETYPCDKEGCNFVGLEPSELSQHTNLVHDVGKVGLESTAVITEVAVDGGSEGDVDLKVPTAQKQVKRNVRKSKASGTKTANIKLRPNSKGKYQCHMCGLHMSTKKNYTYHLFRKHEVLVKGMSLFNCPKCDYVAPDTHMLNRHVKTHGRLEKLETYLSGDSSTGPVVEGSTVGGRKVVKSPPEEEDPLKYTHNMTLLQFKCYMCPDIAEFENRDQLDAHCKREHIQIESGRMKAKCPHCATNFPFKTPKKLNPRALNIITRLIQKAYYKLLKHLIYKHNYKYPDFIKRFTCDVPGCDFSCLTPFHLNQHHLSRHDPQKQVVCTKCGKVYSQFYIETHTKMCQVDDEERRKHLCEFCVKSFMSKGNLFDHIKKVHTPSAHFNCETCGDTLKTRSSLKLHMLTKHGILSEGMSLHNCPMCDFKHPQLATVKKHIDSHLGADPKKFVCTVCGNVYPTKGSLSRHAECHSDVLLRCDQCGYQTHSSTNLKSHRRIKHSGHTYTCGCGYTTQYIGGYNKHQKKCQAVLDQQLIGALTQ